MQYESKITIGETSIDLWTLEKDMIKRGVEIQITRSVLKCKIHRVNLSRLRGKG